MNKNLDQSIAYVLETEGGFVNNPRDPGGPTNKGITQVVYNNYRDTHQLPRQSVELISDIEVEAIYEANYWDRVDGDSLPSGVDYCVFDFAVNSGSSRAIQFLQLVVGVTADAHLGPVTLAAVSARPAAEIVDDLCDKRQIFLEGLPTFAEFGNGWTERVKTVRAQAKAMIDG